MRNRPPGVTDSYRGQTLVEVAVACVLMVVIFGAGLSISVESRDAWSHLYHDTSALQAARESLRILATELATSRPNRVTITAGSPHDAIEFQTPVSLAGETITWGADGVAGQRIRVAVENGRLVRQVKNATGGQVMRARLLVRNVDGLHAGQKGFSVSRDGAFCTIAVRIRAEQDGHVWRRQVTTGVLLRN